MRDDQLPPLPKPEFGNGWDAALAVYTADDMQQYAQAALEMYKARCAHEPVQMTDAQIEVAFRAAGGRWDGSRWIIEDADLHPMARGLISAAVQQPAPRAPLTDAVINAARAAMDESTEAYDGAMSIKIPSHLAASLSLCLDEYDRASSIGQEGGAA